MNPVDFVFLVIYAWVIFEHHFWSYFIVFAALFALDFVWAIYTKAIADDRAMKASLTAMAIIVLSGTAVMKYAHDATMLVPAALGAFAGTYASIWAKKRGWM